MRELNLRAGKYAKDGEHFHWYSPRKGQVGGFHGSPESSDITCAPDILPNERDLAERILEQYSRSPADYFKLYPEKMLFFSEDYKCFIAYETDYKVAVCLGAPSGPLNLIEPTIHSFMQRCQTYGWEAVFLAPEVTGPFSNLPFKSVKFGQEAVVNLETFSQKTQHKHEFDRVRRHLETQGYTFSEHIPPHSSRFLAELRKTSDEWLSLPGRTEHAFTEGRFETECLNRLLIYTVSSPDKQILAFTNRVPSYLPDICTADLMRHRKQIPHGVMEYLFTKLMLLLYERGYQKFSLALAPFSGVGSGLHPKLSERFIRLVYNLTNRFYSFRGLRYFKAQFEPEWIDRYIFYQGGAIGLIRAFLALSRVTSVKYNTRHKLVSRKNEFKI